MKPHLLCIVGTRPEAIKMAPVILALKAQHWARVTVAVTAQHRDLLDQVFPVFGIAPDVDLDLMTRDQSLADLSAKVLSGLDGIYHDLAPDLVIAQGDTTTVAMAALAAFYRRIPFAHVEAGLRTGDLSKPFPEELNRVLAGRLAALHFAPTTAARDALLAEGTNPSTVQVTGNTVIDALLMVKDDARLNVTELSPQRRTILMTAHRREHFGEPMRELFLAARRLVDAHDDTQLLYPVHPNPAVRSLADEVLAGHPRIVLCPPLEYLPFVAAMREATLILTDSGGVQEEAPALGKPVLVMRETTERPEAVDAGVARLVGRDGDRLVAEASRLLTDPDAYRAMARGVSPYGDGLAAGRIAQACQAFLGG